MHRQVGGLCQQHGAILSLDIDALRSPQERVRGRAQPTQVGTGGNSGAQQSQDRYQKCTQDLSHYVNRRRLARAWPQRAARRGQ